MRPSLASARESGECVGLSRRVPSVSFNNFFFSFLLGRRHENRHHNAISCDLRRAASLGPGARGFDVFLLSPLKSRPSGPGIRLDAHTPSVRDRVVPSAAIRSIVAIIFIFYDDIITVGRTAHVGRVRF